MSPKFQPCSNQRKVMSKCVEKLPHRTDKCNSANGLQVFKHDDGKYDGYCFSCGTYVPNPYEDRPAGYVPKAVVKSAEEIQREIAEVDDFQCLSLPDRKLKKEYLEYFGVKIGVSENDGVTPVSHYYPYRNVNDELIGYKVRLIENKRMWAVGSIKGAAFFGWDKAVAAGGKKLFITEGELDAVALFQIFKDQNKGTQYAEFNPAIVSLSNGAGGAAKQITAMLPEMRKHFKEFILVFDTDEPGKKAAEDVIRILPEAMVATLPSKDANQCLIDGRSKACYNACQFNAQKPKNTRLVTGDSLHESAKEAPEYGVSWPWKHITEATRGIRLGETIYIGAGQKQGKSEIVNTLAAHFIREHGWKVFLVKPEESNKKTYKLVAGKLTGKFFHDPNKPFDENAYEDAGKVLAGHLYMLNLYQHVGWDSLKADIRQAAIEGCKVIIIDPITNLTNGMDAASANTKLQEIAQELSAMALDLNVVIFIFCHLRNPDGGQPHERGGEVLSSQFAGSRAMARSCNLMLGLEGNRDPNLPREERNVRTLVLLEDREFGETGRYKLYWDQNTGLFNEI
jgi:twinkle protein